MSSLRGGAAPTSTASTDCASTTSTGTSSPPFRDNLLAVTDSASAIRTVLSNDDDQAAPHLIDAEVTNVAITHERLGKLDSTAARLAIDDLARWGGRRWPHQPLLTRVWELRHNVRSFDALYVALAERLDATLVTSDARLASAPGLRCPVLVPT